MDSNPPTAADYANHTAQTAQSRVKLLEDRMTELEKHLVEVTGLLETIAMQLTKKKR